MNTSHQGAHAPGPLVQAPDRRINEIDEALRLLEAGSAAKQQSSFASDPFRIHQTGNQRLGREPLFVGVVIHTLAGLGWYKVQAGGGRGWIAACQISAGSLNPLGVRDIGAIQPNTRVLIYKPSGLNYGMILGALPPLLRTGKIVNPDWLVAGGQSGYKREAAHQYVIKSLYANGGVLDFSGQRPVDGTALERGWIASTGIALMLDDYQAYLRVNEQCGLFLNYYDSYTRLAGVALDIVSAVHEEACRDDEGESHYFKGIAYCPWEGLGLYAPGTPFTATGDDKDVQYKQAIAKVDLPADAADTQPFYRWQEYGGYLGQGHLRRLTTKPVAAAGVRRYSDTDPDISLFSEAIGIDGSVHINSAKSVLITRRVKMVAPKLTKPSEDATGDDSVADNYRFSGQFGGGAAHKLAEIQVSDEQAALHKIAGIDDLIAFACNWKTLHPFHYHQGDFSVPQEAADDGVFARAQETIDFAVLATQPYLADPIPKKLDIDHRYSSVEFFERTSFFHMLDDGSLALGCGAGAQIVLAGGHIKLEAPGDIQLCPGRDLLMLADQAVLRARQSVDISASEHDVRIKAEKNIQMLSGNGGTGGVLIESKATSSSQQFAEKIGEDVVSNGIILRAPQSAIAALAGSIYLRTGGGDMEDGDIVLDAARGHANVQCFSDETNFYCATGQVRFHYGPIDDVSDVTQTYSFGKDTCLIESNLLLGGRLTAFKNGDKAPAIYLDGPIYCTGSIAAAGKVSDNSGSLLGKVDGTFADAISQITAAGTDVVTALHDGGTTIHTAAIVQTLYQDNQLGNETVVPSLSFTFRDAIDRDQYHVTDLRWLERRWEQMSRFGTGTGGEPWVEKAVTFEGQELYPWPGRKKWQEDAVFLRLSEQTMFDAATGTSRDRPDPYEEPQLADWEPVTMKSAYRLIRKGAS